MNPKPPKIVIWIIHLLVRPENRHTLLGDLEEEFRYVCTEDGKFRASLWYFGQIIFPLINFIRAQIFWSTVMFKNYVKIAIRNIYSHKGFSLINIFGLAVGITCCLLIVLYIQDELKYDSFHTNADCIYRVTASASEDGTATNANGIFGTGPALKKDFPEVLDYVRIRGMGQSTKRFIGYKEKKFYEDRFYFADPQIFTMFSFPLIQGDPENALAGPNSIVITEAMAKKYFPGEDPMGKTMNADPYNSGDMMHLQVTGIAKNVPDQSHFHFDFLISYINQREDLTRFAGFWQHYTYVLLDFAESEKAVEAKLLEFLHRNWREDPWYTNSLQPLLDIRLHSNLRSEIEQNGNVIYIYIFPLIAGFILLIACINFFNMITAQSAQRAKEVGLRKVLGAVRSQLIKQFLGEALIVSLLAGLVSLLLTALVLPQFNTIADKAFTVTALVNPLLFFGWLAIVLIIGFTSGGYAAFFLSRYNPVVTLKGTANVRQSNWLIREGLVLLQFFMSVILIIAMIVIQDQIHFIKSHNPGYARDEIMVIPLNPEVRQNYKVLRNELLADPDIRHMTTSTRVPTRGSIHMNVAVEGREEGVNQVIYYIDKEFIDTYDIPILAGQNIQSQTIQQKNAEFLISAASVTELGFSSPDEALCRKISHRNTEGFIAGVVDDMHLYSFHRSPHAIVYYAVDIRRHDYLSLRLDTSNLESTFHVIKDVWKEIIPGYPLEYFFLDQSFEHMHRTDERLSLVVKFFGILAVFIACMGLFALAAYTVERRRKEIGIRKTLGASGRMIYFMLSKSLLKWVAVSSLLAWPLVYFLMDKWLENFAAKTDLTMFPFLSGSAIIFILIVITISYQTFKAARTNPLESLRYE